MTVWETPRGSVACNVIEKQKADDGQVVMVIELTDSIEGDQFMQAGQRKITTDKYVKELE